MRPYGLRHTGSAHQAKAGFVLAEMLAAMAIGALLLVALASITSFLLHAHDRFMSEMQDAEDSGRAVAALSQDIGMAAHVRWAGRGSAFVFSGTPDRFMLARAVPGSDGLDTIVALLFQARPTKAGMQLLRAESPLSPDVATPEALVWAPPATLYDGPSGIAFAYFMQLDTGGEALLDAWPAGDEMPVAIRITIVPPSPDRQTLSLRVPLLIMAEPSCALPDAASCKLPEAETEGDEGDAGSTAPVDADDTLGWGRYAQ